MKSKTLAEWIKERVIEPKDSLYIYEAEKARIEPEQVSEIAKIFNLSDEIQSELDTYIVRQGKRTLVMYKASGAFYYGDFGKLHQPDYKPKLPSEKEAEKIAIDYLKSNRWWTESAILDRVTMGQFERIEGKRRRQRNVHPNHICVDFRFSLGQLKTYGPGAKIKVFLGHKGEIIGLYYAAQNLHKYAEYPSLSKSRLLEVLSYKLGFSLDKIKIKDITLAYFCGSPVLDNHFVQPVFIFTLSAPVVSKRRQKPTALEFVTHPLPATNFAPIALIEESGNLMKIKQGETLSLSCKVIGGVGPFKFYWESDLDGQLGNESTLRTDRLSIAHREGQITSHTIKVTVTDQYGNQDTHQITVKVLPKEDRKMPGSSITKTSSLTDPDDPFVGVEWCNLYHGSAPDISGTDSSAQGFKTKIQNLPGWSSRFDWGNDNAWEQDFKFTTAPGGGKDSYWADNVHFAFFAGHGSSGSFWFGSNVDDHEQRAQDSRWGDGILNWIVLHACQTMRANFAWDVWCDAFKGLHQMFGFHTNTEGSTPPLGSRFAFWMSFRILPWLDGFDMQTAWKLACTECFDSNMEYAVIYAGQSGTDTYYDHLQGYGHVSSDPTSPTYWAYYKGTC